MTARTETSGRNSTRRESGKKTSSGADIVVVENEKPTKMSNQAKRALRRAMFDEFRKVTVEQLQAAQAELAPYDVEMLAIQRESYLKYLLPEFYK